MIRRPRRTRRAALARAVRIYTDPLQHALIAAGVVAPLVPRSGRRVVVTAVAATIAIDVDHIVAARSARVRDTTALPERPQTHSLVTALTAGALVSAAAGPMQGWAAFGGLASHLLHDAGDHAAPTPLLWPFAPARQIGRRRQIAGTTLLTMASTVIGRVVPASGRGTARGAADADGGRAGARRRTASARS